MKWLNKIIAFPLIFAMSCKPIINPALIIPNNPPAVNLLLSSESGYAPLTTEISLTGTDEDEDIITGYKIKIDVDNDGKIDETIPEDGSFSPEPINIERTFEEGKVRIYGQCQDEHGLNSNQSSKLIKIFKLTENKLPLIENFSADKTSGIYPFTTNVSLTGTDEDGTIAESKLEIYIWEEETKKLDETISEEGNSVNLSRTWGFEDIGKTIEVYGIVMDNDGGETIKSQNITVNGREDLTGNVTSEKNPYSLGDYLSFFGEIKNKSGSKITGESLECKLIKEKEVKFEKSFSGWDIDLKDDDKLTFDYNKDGILCSVFPIRVTMDKYKFEELGEYNLEIIIKYLMNGNEYKQKFCSSPFEVVKE